MQDIDPLAVPAGAQKDPEFPLLKEGAYRLIWESVELSQSKEPNKNTGKHTRFIKVTLSLESDGWSTEGKKIYKGARIFERLNVDPSENATAQQRAEELSMPLKATFGADTKLSWAEVLANPTLIAQSKVDVLVKVKPEDKNYPASNAIKKWVVQRATA